jgi:lambda repressor-like predicted transcriptional regulator
MAAILLLSAMLNPTKWGPMTTEQRAILDTANGAAAALCEALADDTIDPGDASLVKHHAGADPFDVGAILSAALSASGLSAAEVARRTGMAPTNVGRALHSPDTRPPVARRILAALGARVEVVTGKRAR